MCLLAAWPFFFMRTHGIFRNELSMRYEMYSVRDGVYYKHFKTGMRRQWAIRWRGNLYA